MNKMNTTKRMKTVTLLAIGMILGACATQRSKTQDEPSSLLWKIEGKGLEKPSYLYGTIHLICPEDFFLNDATKKALNEVEHIAMELDMDDPAMLAKMQQVSMDPEGKNFSTDMDEEDVKVINDFLRSNYGADLSQLGILKPFALYSMVIIKNLPCEAPASYEQAFVKEAAQREIEITGLETVEYQMGLFDNIPQAELIEWITEAITKNEAAKKEFEQMVEAYKAQNLSSLSEIIMANEQFAGYADVLLYERNKNWISAIEKLAGDKPTLIAVGAGHLGSDQGVITLLQKEGYKVSPVL